MKSNHSPEALIRRALSGDSESFETLVRDSREELTKYVVSRIGDHLRSRIDAEDVVQETCTRAWDSIARLRWTGDGTFIRWLKGIARHVILQQVGRREHTTLIYVEETAQSTEPSPSRAMRRDERFDRLQRAVDRLPRDYREVVVLVRLEGLQIKQAAERMQRSPDAVTHLLARALNQLREELGDTESYCLPPKRFDRGGRDGS